MEVIAGSFLVLVSLAVGYSIMSYNPTETETFGPESPSSMSSGEESDVSSFPDPSMLSTARQRSNPSLSIAAHLMENEWEVSNSSSFGPIEEQRRQAFDRQIQFEENNHNPDAAWERNQRLQSWGHAPLDTRTHPQFDTVRTGFDSRNFGNFGNFGEPVMKSDSEISFHDVDTVRLMTDDLRIEPGATIRIAGTRFDYDGSDFVSSDGRVIDIDTDGSLSIGTGTNPITCDVCETEENAMVVSSDLDSFGEPIDVESLTEHPDESDTVRTLCPTHLVSELND